MTNDWIGVKTDPNFWLYELCPDCGTEALIKGNGTSDCPECGHPEVLPCSSCPRLTPTTDTCDWNEVSRCSEFPRVY